MTLQALDADFMLTRCDRRCKVLCPPATVPTGLAALSLVHNWSSPGYFAHLPQCQLASGLGPLHSGPHRNSLTARAASPLSPAQGQPHWSPGFGSTLLC